MRTLSYSEVSTALECQARWDFRYGEQLAGSSLKEKTVVPRLSEGRAWGAAVAAFHTSLGQFQPGQEAIDAMDASLDADAELQKAEGLYSDEAHMQMRTDLLAMLVHYTDTAEPVEMDPVTERELLVPIPSRGGVRRSNRYRLHCFLDATSTTPDRSVWIEEFKLRGRLSDVRLIIRSPQIRWYAWAYWQATGIRPAGVNVTERLRSIPKQPRVLKGGKLSHAKDQLCTLDAYLAACEEHDVEPDDVTADHLGRRQWQQRVPVVFRESELEQAGEDLISAAKLIRQLDSAELRPLRNARPAICSGCPYTEICDDPTSSFVDTQFDRRPPKRLRETEGAAT
jgi:hypothetical protein